ncbi:MAG TPA: hypothetical protein VJZ72_05415, partial [Candidatus Limnocylindrales bacterium]|nr:hypothetical protein [Candidatus Limnocylindrales bacterium]
VATAVTAPAVSDMLEQLERIRESPVESGELVAARDFLVGVFPLRFETPGPVVTALTGIAVHGLPDDELARYRPAIEAVTIDAVLASARKRIRPERFAIVMVADADQVVPDLEAAGLTPLVIDRDDGG